VRRASAAIVAAVAVAVGGCGPVQSSDRDGTWSLTYTLPSHPAPCAVEDQTTPCRWDATASGNGVGDSFTVGTSPTGYVVAYDNGTVLFFKDPDAPASTAIVTCPFGEWVTPFDDNGHTSWTCEGP